MRVEFGTLGSVAAWDGEGAPIGLRGPRHRAVLARLLIARGRVVPVDRLVGDLWVAPPEGAVSALRTFVAALRRALEPDRAPRSPARLLVTEGPGYALRADPQSVDAWRFEAALESASGAAPGRALDLLDEASHWWRGPALAGFEDESWARAEHTRLEELRLTAVERRAEALLALDRPSEAVPDLEAHTADHPWREDAWRLMALGLYRSGRQADALAVVRRASGMLRDRLGLEPSPRLRRLEADLLRQRDESDPRTDQPWSRATAAWERAVTADSRARLESTVSLLREVALTGPTGLAAAREQRIAAIDAAEQRGDPELTARVIGDHDVPAIWTRSDDPALASRVVAAAERALAALPADASDAVRARLLTVMALESRATGEPRARRAAEEAERIARRLGDPTLLAFALNGVYMQCFDRTGRAPARDAIGAELVELSRLHGLSGFEILGRLIRVQARSALGDFAGADEHAAAADRLAERHERPLVAVFTGGYRAMRRAAGDTSVAESEAAYREAAEQLGSTGMPGVERGLLPLALLCLRVWRRTPPEPVLDPDDRPDWGPYAPWVQPVLLAFRGQREEAVEALRRAPEPPPDLLAEALWCLLSAAAIEIGDRETMSRARAALEPAAGELAAGSGMLTAGPIADWLARLDAAAPR
ncbi:AfsR/SARP family transcriptional regulator [Glycomyces buryatensis]|uniref:AfsR/SARP family transcriptional regulator n=1 Tax=Glycomyces buryatensis TaxID=2570927 RepID=A0A4S8QFN0_9ACTN|nr:AfsR/SARP family transcriptional regulator [Glycomyces buryatensis]